MTGTEHTGGRALAADFSLRVWNALIATANLAFIRSASSPSDNFLFAPLLSTLAAADSSSLLIEADRRAWIRSDRGESAEREAELKSNALEDVDSDRDDRETCRQRRLGRTIEDSRGQVEDLSMASSSQRLTRTRDEIPVF